MAKKLEVYKCEICGNIVEILHGGKGKLICCGQEMILLILKTEDQGKEKHVPVIEKTENTLNVKVGSIPHPMEENHFIEWIEVITENGILRKFLKPGEKPEAVFETNENIIELREYCSIHGLWKG